MKVLSARLTLASRGRVKNTSESAVMPAFARDTGHKWSAEHCSGMVSFATPGRAMLGAPTPHIINHTLFPLFRSTSTTQNTSHENASDQQARGLHCPRLGMQAGAVHLERPQGVQGQVSQILHACGDARAAQAAAGVGPSGIAAQKQSCREQACSAGAVVAAAVRAWAEDQGNLTIAGKVKYSYSDLVGGRDTASQDRCQTVQAVAEELIAPLKDCGVDADVLEDLQEKIDAYATCISKPREAIATGKTLTKQIEKGFEAADGLLANGLDELILSFQSTAPTFFDDYRNARAVVNRAATRDTAEGDNTAPAPKAA